MSDEARAMIEEAPIEQAPRRGRPAGYICHVCQEPIPVLDMINVVLSAMWSVELPELPQLVRTLHLHNGICAEVYIQNWHRDKAAD